MTASTDSQTRRTIPLLIAVCLMSFPAYAKYAGGSGTPQDPYQTATATDLIALGATPEDYDKHFILTADIDLDPNLPGRKVFNAAVIAPDTDSGKDGFQGIPFTGVLDGSGHTISHLTLAGRNYLGLFGRLEFDAEVKDLGIVDVKATGSGDYVGGLVGRNGEFRSLWSYGGVLTNCYSTGTISGGSSVGGLVGDSEGGVTNCHSAGAVRGADSVGGLVGSNLRGAVTRCYSTGTVTGNQDTGGLVGNNAGEVFLCYSTAAVIGTDCVGGLVGGNYWDNLGWLVGEVAQCYSTGSVSGAKYVGGLVGYDERSPYEGTQCFWDTQTSGQTISARGTGKTTAQMHDPNTFRTAGWDFTPHDIWFEPQGGGYPVLWWQISPWPSLPTFSGGTGEPNDPYLISTAKDLNSIGHNPRLMQCHFKLVVDLDLTGLHFYPIGGDYHYPYRSVFDGNGHTISHLTSQGSPFGTLFHGGEVKNLGVVDVNVTGSGGLVGENGGTVTRCYSTGAVSGTSDVGGLVGYNDGSVTQCYSTAAVSGNREVVGGLIGRNYGNVTDCYSAGMVGGTGWPAGGLVGENYGDVTRCYSTAAVSSTPRGGLVGHRSGGDVIDSFWDTDTSGQGWSLGGTGKTTAQMQTAKTFLDAGWDFVGETANGTEDIWWILEGKDYPRLWWEAAKKRTGTAEL